MYATSSRASSPRFRKSPFMSSQTLFKRLCAFACATASSAAAPKASPDISHGVVRRGCESEKIVVQQRFSPDWQSAPMPTECSADLFGFTAVEGREVIAAFDGGSITSDAGALLLRETDRAIGLVSRFAACFHDTRRQELIE